MGRLSHFAPEEIAAAVLLALALSLVALRPSTVTHLFDTPFATPVPGGGPARQLVPDPRPTPSPVTLSLPADGRQG